MRKLLAIAAILMVSLTGVAQYVATIGTLLKGKDINALKDHLNIQDHLVFITRNVQREIFPGYEEWSGTINVFRNDGKGRCDNYHLQVLNTGKYIFYYRFTVARFKDTAGSIDAWRSYDVLIDSFTDVSIYKGFEKNFIKTFGVSIDKSEMFSDKIVFGDLCGYAASPPYYRQKLDSLLEKRDTKTILSWLRSPNTEKQLYGLHGASILDHQGYKISADDEQIIKIIRQKKGFAFTCGGCIFSRDSIHKVIAEIDLMNGRYLPTINKSDVSGGFMYGVAGLVLLIAGIVCYLGVRFRKAH